MQPEALRIEPYGSCTIHKSECSSELNDMYKFGIVNFEVDGESIKIFNNLSRDIVVNTKQKAVAPKQVQQNTKKEKQQ